MNPTSRSASAAFALIAWLWLGAWGCSVPDPDHKDEPKPDHPNNAASAPVESAEPITATLSDQRRLPNSIILGLDADMSSGSGQSGEAIRRGMVLAVDEINAQGGLLNRPLELIVCDHRGNPDRGVDNIQEFATMPDVLAVMGGLHTPVVIRELEAIHQNKIVFLVPWAAGTPVVANGFKPNFVFRVSVRDEYAGGFLVDCAKRGGSSRAGLLLERTSWGRSNEVAMLRAIEQQGLQSAGVHWFNWGETKIGSKLDRLINDGAEVILLVCNPLEGASVVQAMAKRPPEQRVPIISHWGITGADFPELVGEALQEIDLTFLQTHSFIEPKIPDRTAKLFNAYQKRFDDCRTPRDIRSPVGTAHAYELVQMLAVAVQRAQSLDRDTVRQAMEQLGRYEGIIRDYDPPFTPTRHDALSAEDFCLARFDDDGTIVPTSVHQD